MMFRAFIFIFGVYVNHLPPFCPLMPLVSFPCLILLSMPIHKSVIVMAKKLVYLFILDHSSHLLSLRLTTPS